MQSTPTDPAFAGYRRRIELLPFDGGIRAGLEDDFHRFTLTLTFDGDRIATVDGTTERTPWSVCPGALPYLADALQGRAFSEVQAMARDMDHCTHLLDMAVLATAHAADKAATRFDLTVSDPVDDRREARLYQGGDLALAWTLAGDAIAGPAQFAGFELRRLRVWAADLPADLAEKATLLRRAAFISQGRRLKTDAPFDVAVHRQKRGGSCYTYTGDRLQDVARKPDWREDFSARPEALLVDWPRSSASRS